MASLPSGETNTRAAPPPTTPLSVAVCGEPSASDTTVSVPADGTALGAVYVTRTVQVAPAASAAGNAAAQVPPVRANPVPPTEMEPIAIATLPLLDSAKVIAPLAAPIDGEVSVAVAGSSVCTGACASTDSGTLISCVFGPCVAVSAIRAVLSPMGATGLARAPVAQLAPPASDAHAGTVMPKLAISAPASACTRLTVDAVALVIVNACALLFWPTRVGANANDAGATVTSGVSQDRHPTTMVSTT